MWAVSFLEALSCTGQRDLNGTRSHGQPRCQGRGCSLDCRFGFDLLTRRNADVFWIFSRQLWFLRAFPQLSDGTGLFLDASASWCVSAEQGHDFLRCSLDSTPKIGAPKAETRITTSAVPFGICPRPGLDLLFKGVLRGSTRLHPPNRGS